MDVKKIKYLLDLIDETFSSVGRNLAVHESCVRGVCARETRSRKVEEGVANLLGLTLHQVFPDWYSSDNCRISARKKREMAVDARAKARADIQRFANEQIAA